LQLIGLLRKNKKDDRILREVEEFVDSYYNKEYFGFLIERQKEEIKHMED